MLRTWNLFICGLHSCYNFTAPRSCFHLHCVYFSVISRFDKNPESLKNVAIGNSEASVSPNARNLGVYVDNYLNLSTHVTRLCQSASNSLRMIGQVRKYLDKKHVETLVHAYITSKLDNCNSLLYNLPEYLINKLQRIQNMAARLVTLTRKTTHITPVLYNLHWLPVSQRIKFKILLLTYKALHGQSPQYITE